MKILFNCTNNIVGGAIQNSANFIKNALDDDKHIFLFLVSKEVEKILIAWSVDTTNVVAFNRKNDLKSHVNKILEIEKEFNPDVVYTMAGPTYINFRTTHVMGISDGYITHAKLKNFFFNRSVKEAILMFLKSSIKGFIARLSADYYIFQTETSRSGFCKRFLFSKKKTFIANNAINEIFLMHNLINRSSTVKKDFYEILCPSAYYSHKDLEILFEVSSILDEKNKIRFLTTIDNLDFIKLCKKYKNNKGIVNLGPYSYTDAIEIYEVCDAVIQPSTLETFSTTYIEAIALKKPLIVTDADFSKEICGSYAHYFKTGSRQSLLRLLESNEFKDNYHKFKERDSILSKYGTQINRYNKIIGYLETIK